jgi:polyisoprenoid-binding protein YceI
MKTAKKSVALLTGILFTVLLNAQTNWTPDKNHTKIGFTAIHYTITEVEGEFREFDANITSDTDDFDGAKVNFVAKVASLSTNNERRDNHLKGDDFFNAEKYPELKFDGNFKKTDGKYYLIGDLTVRDVTRPIKFDVKYGGTISLGDKGRKAGFKISGAIDRFDYGLKWNSVIETGGLVVEREIKITCNLELNEAKP